MLVLHEMFDGRANVGASEDKKRKRTLSRGGIVDAAYHMIDRDGVDAFTMRALGTELGVSAMAFYAHFPSRDDVLAAVLTRFMDTMDTDAVPGECWDDTLRRTMTSIHREFLSHPHMYDIDFDPEVSYEGLAVHTAKIVNLHLGQGMPEEVLTKAWAMIDAFLSGFSANAIAGKKLDDAAAAAGTEGRKLETWERIVRNAYTEDSFQNGVEFIISGIRVLAAPDPCDWRTPEA